MMRTILLLLALLTVTTQTGCIIYYPRSYPEKWTSIDNHSEICATLPGNYKNSGEAGESGRNAPPLTSLLFSKAGPATNVRIQRKGETTFLLSAESSGTVIASRTIEGKCGSPKLTVLPEVPDSFINRQGVVAYNYESVELETSTDRALVARSTTGGFGIMLLIPAAGSESRWFHYFREDEELKGADSNEKP